MYSVTPSHMPICSPVGRRPELCAGIDVIVAFSVVGPMINKGEVIQHCQVAMDAFPQELKKQSLATIRQGRGRKKSPVR